MDDELKRKIAASLDLPPGAASDPAVTLALAKDPQARDYERGLLAIESSLRNWPERERSAGDWEKSAVAIERRLGEAPWEKTAKVRGAVQALSWDPFDPPPLREEADDANESEHKSMAQSHDDKDNDDDLGALAALTRTSLSPGAASIPPPALKAGPSISDDGMDDSSGIVDIKQLAALARNQSAPPSSASLAATPSDVGGNFDAAVMAGEAVTPRAAAAAAIVPAANASAEAAAKKSEAKADKKSDTTAAKSSATAAAAAKPVEAKKASVAIWLVPVAAAAVIGGVVMMRSNDSAAPTAASAPATAAPESAAAEAPQGSAANSAAAAPAMPTTPAPVVAAAAPAQAPAEPGAPPPPPSSADQPSNAAPQPQAAVAANSAVGAAGPAAGAPRAVEAPQAAPAPQVAARTEERPAAHRAEHSQPASATASAEPAAAPTPTAHAARAGGGGGTTVAAAAPAPEPAPAPAAAPARAPAASGSGSAAAAPAAGSAGHPRSIDELMAAATGGSHPGTTATAANGGARPAASAAPAAAAEPAEIPQTLTRALATATLTPLSSAVRACTQGATGMATVAIRILGNGTVESASVSGPFTPEANNCISGVVRRAHFPQFQRPNVTIAYPFSIQPARPGGH